MDIEKIKTQMCDNYCKHFAEIRATFEDIDRGQEELDRICEHCPLNELEEVEVITQKDAEPIPHWRGQMDGCLPFQEEE